MSRLAARAALLSLIAGVLLLTAMSAPPIRGGSRALAQDSAFSASVLCDSTTVAVHGQFHCSMGLTNSGAVTLAGINARATFLLCLRDGSCCVCIAGVFPLYFSSAEPPWNGRTFQYSWPYWDPLGSGVLEPGDSSTVTVTVDAVRLAAQGGGPGSRPAVCLHGSAQAPKGGRTHHGQKLRYHRHRGVVTSDGHAHAHHDRGSHRGSTADAACAHRGATHRDTYRRPDRRGHTQPDTHQAHTNADIGRRL